MPIRTLRRGSDSIDNQTERTVRMKHSIGFVGVAAWFVCFVGMAYGQTAEELNERLSDVEDRLDEVEKKTILDRISLSGDYRMVLNSYLFEGDTDGDGENEDHTTEELWSHRIRINLVANPVDSVRITARLAMYKHFGDNDSPAFVPDFERSRLPRDSIARFDQAWDRLVYYRLARAVRRAHRLSRRSPRRLIQQ